MAKILIVVAWIALIVWWITPSVDNVRNKINKHNAQIQKALEE